MSMTCKCQYDNKDKITEKSMNKSIKKYMQINMDEALVFRKLTPQEKILLSAMNYLKK